MPPEPSTPVAEKRREGGTRRRRPRTRRGGDARERDAGMRLGPPCGTGPSLSGNTHSRPTVAIDGRRRRPPPLVAHVAPGPPHVVLTRIRTHHHHRHPHAPGMCADSSGKRRRCASLWTPRLCSQVCHRRRGERQTPARDEAAGLPSATRCASKRPAAAPEQTVYNKQVPTASTPVSGGRRLQERLVTLGLAEARISWQAGWERSVRGRSPPAVSAPRTSVHA